MENRKKQTEAKVQPASLIGCRGDALEEVNRKRDERERKIDGRGRGGLRAREAGKASSRYIVIGRRAFGYVEQAASATMEDI